MGAFTRPQMRTLLVLLVVQVDDFRPLGGVMAETQENRGQGARGTKRVGQSEVSKREIWRLEPRPTLQRGVFAPLRGIFRIISRQGAKARRKYGGNHGLQGGAKV